VPVLPVEAQQEERWPQQKCRQDRRSHEGKARDRQGDDAMIHESPTTGPMLPARDYKHDLKYFTPLVERLSEWRSDDHEDAIVLTRNQIIELLEGIKELKRAPERILARQNLSNRAEA
jgi:hypothetical protein